MGRLVTVIGHFAAGTSGIGGQIRRTRLFADEVEARVPNAEVVRIDTSTLSSKPIRVIWSIWQAFRRSTHVVVMPGPRGLRWLGPLYARWKRKTGVRLSYLVVGGWLPRFLSERPGLVSNLTHFDSLHIQSPKMVEALRSLGLEQTHYLANFRRFDPPPAPTVDFDRPLRLAFLSRVIPAKGVGLAMEAVERVNLDTDHGCTLDIWGPVPAEHRAWFDELLERFGPHSRYRGVLAPEDIQTMLAQRDALLFPTAYSGEGFPGVIVDAYSAGIPVIATHWPYAEEVIDHGKSGILLDERSVPALEATLARLSADPSLLHNLSKGATDRALAYHVDFVVPPLLRSLGLAGSTLEEDLSDPSTYKPHNTCA